MKALLLPRLFVLTLLLTLATSAALIIGRGGPTPAHVAMLHLTDCELPCWIGIMPGKTGIDEARAKIRSVFQAFQLESSTAGSIMQIDVKDGGSRLLGIELSTLYPSKIINSITLIFCDSWCRVTYGDFAALYGPPDVIVPSPAGRYANPAAIYYRNKILVGSGSNARLTSPCDQLLASQRLANLVLYTHAPPDDGTNPPTQHWRGFRTCYS